MSSTSRTPFYFSDGSYFSETQLIVTQNTPSVASYPERKASKTMQARFIYGTAWKKEKTAELVYQAVLSGFRSIDTAAQPRHYCESEVGRAIRTAIQQGIVRREDITVSR